MYWRGVTALTCARRCGAFVLVAPPCLCCAGAAARTAEAADRRPVTRRRPRSFARRRAAVAGRDRQADACSAPACRCCRGSIVHYHAHLDVFYDGEAVTVPADVGIDVDRSASRRCTRTPTAASSTSRRTKTRSSRSAVPHRVGREGRSDGCVADKCGDEVAVFVNGSIQDTPPPTS